jgi:hypothetical protein
LDKDKSISRAELKKYYDGPIYDYLYEDALSNPKKWMEKWANFRPREMGLFNILDRNKNEKISLLELQS